MRFLRWPLTKKLSSVPALGLGLLLFFADAGMAAKPVSLRKAGLIRPEVEVKLTPPNKKTFNALRDLVGKEITLRDMKGKPVLYTIDFETFLSYRDVYYDVVGVDGSLGLYDKGGALRARARWYPNEKGDKVFDFIKFQAKDSSVDLSAKKQTGTLSRNEILGSKFKKLSKFDRKREKILRGKRADEAVAFARAQVGPFGKFKPILGVIQKRFFMTVNPKNSNANAPSFHLSLDRVDFEGLFGEKGKNRERFIELEIADKLAEDTPLRVQKKMYLLNQFKKHLIREFDLTPAHSDKYSLGVDSTVH